MSAYICNPDRRGRFWSCWSHSWENLGRIAVRIEWRWNGGVLMDVDLLEVGITGGPEVRFQPIESLDLMAGLLQSSVSQILGIGRWKNARIQEKFWRIGELNHDCTSRKHPTSVRYLTLLTLLAAILFYKLFFFGAIQKIQKIQNLKRQETHVKFSDIHTHINLNWKLRQLHRCA